MCLGQECRTFTRFLGWVIIFLKTLISHIERGNSVFCSVLEETDEEKSGYPGGMVQHTECLRPAEIHVLKP